MKTHAMTTEAGEEVQAPYLTAQEYWLLIDAIKFTVGSPESYSGRLESEYKTIEHKILASISNREKARQDHEDALCSLK